MSRELVLGLLALAYVAFAAMSNGGGLTALATGGVAAALLLAAHRRERSVLGGDARKATAWRAARFTLFGCAVFAVARTGEPGHAALDAAANLGAGVACVASLWALARVQPLGGMLQPPRAAESLDAAAFVGMLWGIATAIAASFALFPGRVARDPLLIDYATTSAAAGALLVHVVATLRLRVLRRHELGVGDRAGSAFALSSTALAVAILGGSLGLAPPDRFLPAAACVSALLGVWAATTAEPTRVSRGLRALLAVAVLGVPIVVGAGVLAHAKPHAAGTILLGASALSIVVGLLARTVAKPLGPEQSRWLTAIEAAHRAALSPEPNQALTAALMALQKACGASGARVEIWRRVPSELLHVDVAGYLHVERAESPERLYELALGEPERTVRADALAVVQVRRPEVRGLLGWFQSRGAFSATVVCDEDGPLGFVLLPRGKRQSALTLEEARAIRTLADRISSLIAVSAALSRSRERELAAEARADALALDCERLTRTLGGVSERHRIHTERLAAPLRATSYGPGSQMALHGLTRLAKGEEPFAVVVPPGVPALQYVAHAHLESPRADGPLIVVDGAEPAERELARWEEAERSPLTLADSGTLFVANAAALPLETQQLLARLLLRRKLGEAAELTAHGPRLAFGLPRAAQELVAEARLDPELARAIAARELTLPSLAERAEDLRSLVLFILSRAGMARRGEPLGIEPAALAAITERDFAGNELELTALLERAAARARGLRVSVADLGLAPDPATQDESRSREDPDDPEDPDDAADPSERAPSLAVRRRSLRRAPGRR